MIEIIKYRKYFFVFSGLLMALSFAAVVGWGFKPNIDFTGGSLVEVNFAKDRPELTAIETRLEKDFGEIVTQATSDNGYIFKLRYLNGDEHQKFLTTVKTEFGKAENVVTEKRSETIGPAVSEVLKRRSLSAGLAVALAIVAFIAYSFRKVSKPIASWKFGVAAIVSLVHDVGIAMGVFAALGHFYGIQVDIPFVVALLTILGYSVNDTIVVFDRIREKLTRRSGESFAELTNKAINETLWRSLNTSVTVLLVLTSLFFLGAESTKYFTLALLIGIFFGTYSSIFLASTLLVEWELWDRRRK